MTTQHDNPRFLKALRRWFIFASLLATILAVLSAPSVGTLNNASIGLLNSQFLQPDALLQAEVSARFAAAYALDPSSSRARFGYAVGLLGSGQITQTLQFLGRAQPHEAEQLYLIGRRLTGEHAYDLARPYLLAATQLVDRLPYMDALAALEFDDRNGRGFMQATEQLAHFVAETSHISRDDTQGLMWAYYWLGQRSRLEQDWPSAVSWFQKLLRIDGAFPFANLAVAEALLEQKKCESALSYLNLAINQTPNSYWPYQYLALCYEQLGRVSEAALLLTRAKQYRATSGMPQQSWGRELFWLSVSELQTSFQ